MQVRRKGGMTEMIPNRQERRDGVIRDHVLELLENLHFRIRRLERGSLVGEDDGAGFERLLDRIRREESAAEATRATVKSEEKGHSERGQRVSRPPS